ncbi:MAG TPA: hypothetical protein VFA06_15410 [Actinocrinis sp.]|uniref:hypothetical protein n=1 Tax=Actinocrinis sp. TaxID=1920516 RepID=UPI002D2CF8CD|nr:hypothetical protein [Actinocrinis sp.]HZU57258.1 hypothetical protein [Actinocrinis sp.]
MRVTVRRLLLAVLRLAVLGLAIRLLTVAGLILRLLRGLLRRRLVLIRALLRGLRRGRRRETGLRLLGHARDLILHRALRRVLDRRQRGRNRRVRGRADLVAPRLVRQVAQGVTGRGGLLLGRLRLTLGLLRLIRCAAHPFLLTGSLSPSSGFAGSATFSSALNGY